MTLRFTLTLALLPGLLAAQTIHGTRLNRQVHRSSTTLNLNGQPLAAQEFSVQVANGPADLQPVSAVAVYQSECSDRTVALPLTVETLAPQHYRARLYFDALRPDDDGCGWRWTAARMDFQPHPNDSAVHYTASVGVNDGDGSGYRRDFSLHLRRYNQRGNRSLPQTVALTPLAPLQTQQPNPERALFHYEVRPLSP